jgi:cell filamentation protein
LAENQGRDPYLDPATGVLSNKINAVTWTELHIAEADLTRLRLLEMIEKPIAGYLDLAHLQAIHRHLFRDVYPFAGELRTVDMRKVNDPAGFFPAGRLRDGAAYVFGALREERHLQGLAREPFTARLAHHLDAINHLHPFREGNVRAQRTFVSQLAGRAGYVVDWTQVTGAVNDAAFQAGEDELRAMLAAITRPSSESGVAAEREALASATQRPRRQR